MKITINTPGFDYAFSELKLLLGKYTDLTFGEDGDRVISVSTDLSLPVHCYLLDGDGQTLKIRGGSKSAALCGVYDALRRAGIVFHAGGNFCAGEFDLTAFFAAKASVHPKFRLRGIRQHINFPMDISSYPLKDAQEYIRCMARLGFNAITFHSYGDQWHPVTPGKDHFGHFFYGQRHPLPEDPILRPRIRNRKEYVNPEAEDLMDQPEKLDSFVSGWLASVMKTAKEAEMTVTLSVELPEDDKDKIGAMLANVCRLYPDIDTLELISGENTTTETRYTVPQIGEVLGKEALEDDGSLTNAEELGENMPSEFHYCIEFLSRALTAIRTKDEWTAGLSKVPGLRVGIYNTTPQILKVVRPILRRVIPAGITHSFLPAHGSKAVVGHMKYMGVTDEDFSDTMFYSWAEFDGNMYIQQLACLGIGELADMAPQDSYGVCINHWRTAENDLSIVYASRTLAEPLPTESFYKNAAKVLSLDEKELVPVLKRMENLDVFCRDQLFNIGFCSYKCWSAQTGLGWISEMHENDIGYAISEFSDYAAVFGKLSETSRTPEGTAFVSLWKNRCECSVLHLNAVLSMKNAWKKKNGRDVNASFDEAADYARRYTLLYSELLPDRGGEGLIVSYLQTIPRYIESRRKYCVGNSVFSPGRIICRLAASYLTVSAATAFFVSGKFTRLYFAQNVPLPLLLADMALLFILFSLIAKNVPKIHTDSCFLAASSAACAAAWLNRYGMPSLLYDVTYDNDRSRLLFLIALILFLCPVFIYFLHTNKFLLSKFHPGRRTVTVFAVFCGLAGCAMIALLTVLRYRTYTSGNFDFGIFCDIFDNMKKTGLPLVTGERDVLLSHFAVHLSPVLYLLLPFYWIFPSPLTLQIGQAVILMSGVIPVLLLCRHFRLDNKTTMALCFLFCAYPAISCGCFFDFHENCFLVPLLLWMFYFFEKEETVPTAVFALLVLSVKEDAAIYLIFFALYVILARKKYRFGIVMGVLSAIWMVTAIGILNASASYWAQYYENLKITANPEIAGAMVSRFDNLIFDKTAGLAGAVKTALVNPGYLLTQIFGTPEADGGKLIYLFEMLVPLGMLPFCTKKPSEWLLSAPLLVNLLTMYRWQYSISYQYSFAIIAFLFYASLRNAAAFGTETEDTPALSDEAAAAAEKRRDLLMIGIIACICLYAVFVFSGTVKYVKRWEKGKETYREIDALLETIPKDASVCATAHLVPHLYDRAAVYDMKYHNNEADVDYVVFYYPYIDRYSRDEYLKKGYSVILDEPDKLLILSGSPS